MRATLFLTVLPLSAPAVGQPLSKQESAVAATAEEGVETGLRKLVNATETLARADKGTRRKSSSLVRARHRRVFGGTLSPGPNPPPPSLK